MGIISNCLMAGDMNIGTTGGDVICRNSSKAVIQDTYYYTDWSGSVPSAAICADSYDMTSGRLCHLLNAGRTGDKQAWYQTLSEDRFPIPDNRHLPVWSHEGSYINEDPDGIEAIHNSQFIIHNDASAIYDLSGRKMLNGKWLNGKWHGIFIKDGKKIIIK